MTGSARSHWLERWLPFLFTVVVQFVGGVWFAAHLSDNTAQNTKDIAELKLIVVPRPEIEQAKADAKAAQLAETQQLDRIESLLLERGKSAQ